MQDKYLALQHLTRWRCKQLMRLLEKRTDTYKIFLKFSAMSQQHAQAKLCL